MIDTNAEKHSWPWCIPGPIFYFGKYIYLIPTDNWLIVENVMLRYCQSKYNGI